MIHDHDYEEEEELTPRQALAVQAVAALIVFAITIAARGLFGGG